MNNGPGRTTTPAGEVRSRIGLTAHQKRAVQCVADDPPTRPSPELHPVRSTSSNLFPSNLWTGLSTGIRSFLIGRLSEPVSFDVVRSHVLGGQPGRARSASRQRPKVSASIDQRSFPAYERLKLLFASGKSGTMVSASETGSAGQLWKDGSTIFTLDSRP